MPPEHLFNVGPCRKKKNELCIDDKISLAICELIMTYA